MTLAGGVRSALGVVPFVVTSYGTLTSNGSAGIVASKGKLYFDTSTNQLFVNDGSLWKALEVTGANISSLNGLTGISQFLAVSATGTDVALSSVGSTHTIVIPTASGTARGLVSTTTLVHLPRLQ